MTQGQGVYLAGEDMLVGGSDRETERKPAKGKLLRQLQ